MQEVPEKTYGELLRPFMDITEENEAQKRFDFFVEYVMQRRDMEMQEAEKQAREDILTYADGYFDQSLESQSRKLTNVYVLFGKRNWSFNPATNGENDPPPTDPFQRFALISLEDDE